MTGRLTATLLLVAAGVVGIGPASPECVAAQLPPSPSPAPPPGGSPREPEAPGRLVEIDAVVTDRHGKPVPNLGPSDFEIVENGVVQKVNAAEWRGHTAPEARHHEPALDAPLTSEDERRAAREPGTRVIALLLDDFHVSPGAASEHVRKTLLRFLDEQVRPSDLLAVHRPLQSVTGIRFTRDREAARKAIESFAGRKGDYEAQTEFEKKYIGRAPEAVKAARAQIVLSGLRALTSRLAELGAGRAAVVIVSEGFSRLEDRRIERRIPDMQGLIRAASRANVAMYAFDPSGVPDGSQDGSPSEPDDVHGRAFLQRIAVETGGEAVMEPESFAAGLQRMVRDLDGYYLLSYTSSHAGDGRFYDVQIRVKSGKAQVRARTGYWAPIRTAVLAASTRRTAPPRVIRKSPLIDTWLGLTAGSEGAANVTFTWTPADVRGRRASALPKPAVVALKVTTPEGAVLFDGEITAARSGGFGVVRDDAAFFEAEPGRIQLDLTVYAADGSQIDQAAQDVDVPDVRKADPVILPPHVFSSSSAKEFREISSNPAAAPIPSREFRRTERLLIRVPTFSASGTPVTVVARILNRAGQPLRTIEPLSRQGEGITAFDLPLSWLAPGDYTIELNASNSRGSVREIVRIRVTG